MQLAMITIQQVLVLFVLIFAGFICVKAGAVKIEGKKAFSDLLVYFVVPCMIINSYLTDFDSDIFRNILYALWLSVLLIAIGIAVTFILSMRIKDDNLPVVRFGCMFSNAAYMGFPLIQALFGTEGLIYASAFVTVFNILLWTLGYSVVSRTISWKMVVKKIFTTPATLAVFAGIIIFVLRIPMPSVLHQAISAAGAVNTPLSMFITGMIIAASDIKKMFVNKLVYFSIIVRMIIIPAICIAVFELLNIYGMVANIVIILEACPCAAITSVFAVQFNYDDDVAAASVVLTTLVSIVTLPIVAFIITTL